MDIEKTKLLALLLQLQFFTSSALFLTNLINPNLHTILIYNLEVTVYNGGMVDSLYVNVGETLTVKLKVDQYKMISSSDDPCINQVNYSANEVTCPYFIIIFEF